MLSLIKIASGKKMNLYNFLKIYKAYFTTIKMTSACNSYTISVSLEMVGA